MKEIIDKLEFNKIKSFCSAKIMSTENRPGENICKTLIRQRTAIQNIQRTLKSQ